jgi:hypothetical protein
VEQVISRVSKGCDLGMKLIAGLLPYKGELIKGLGETQARSKELRESRKEVADLLRRYNEFVSPFLYP